MVTCPVCEHQQPVAAECAVCGKVLSTARVPDLPAVRLAELEQTGFEALSTPLPDAPMPELEQTRLRSGPDLPAMAVPNLDLARAPAVNVPVEVLPDLDRHRSEANPNERTAAPTGAVVCRYCRNTQAEGRICNVCGMRLPLYISSANANAPAAVSLEDAPIIKHGCGVLTKAGMPCNSCGVFVPMPSPV